MPAQILTDLRALARGLINAIVVQLEYEGLLDVMISGRVDSTDLYAEEARRVLSYIDALWNAYHGLVAQIERTPAAELKSFKEYAVMLPLPPDAAHFKSAVLPEIFDVGRD